MTSSTIEFKKIYFVYSNGLSFCSTDWIHLFLPLFDVFLIFSCYFVYHGFDNFQTEQIRRVNRLFAQDSLFLRQHLMIPVDRDTSLQHNQIMKSMSLPASTNDEELPFFAGSSRPNAAASSTANSNYDMLSPEEESKKSIEDFLGKIDTNLARTKKYVKNRWELKAK